MQNNCMTTHEKSCYFTKLSQCTCNGNTLYFTYHILLKARDIEFIKVVNVSPVKGISWKWTPGQLLLLRCFHRSELPLDQYLFVISPPCCGVECYYQFAFFSLLIDQILMLYKHTIYGNFKLSCIGVPANTTMWLYSVLYIWTCVCQQFNSFLRYKTNYLQTTL